MNTEPILGQKIRQYRKMHSMTQETLAAKIGVDKVHIANVERGRKGLSLDKLVLICRCFHIGLADMLPIDEPDDSELRAKWVGDILDALDMMDTERLGVVRTMVCSLKSE